MPPQEWRRSACWGSTTTTTHLDSKVASGDPKFRFEMPRVGSGDLKIRFEMPRVGSEEAIETN